MNVSRKRKISIFSVNIFLVIGFFTLLFHKHQQYSKCKLLSWGVSFIRSSDYDLNVCLCINLIQMKWKNRQNEMKIFAKHFYIMIQLFQKYCGIHKVLCKIILLSSMKIGFYFVFIFMKKLWNVQVNLSPFSIISEDE